MCDRIVVIAHGRVVADESPAALREQTGESQSGGCLRENHRQRRGTCRMNAVTSKIATQAARLAHRVPEGGEGEPARSPHPRSAPSLPVPCSGRCMLVMLLNITLNRELDKAEQPLPVPVIGADYAPNLIDALKAGGIVPTAADRRSRSGRAQAGCGRGAAHSARLSRKAWRRGEPVQVEADLRLLAARCQYRGGARQPAGRELCAPAGRDAPGRARAVAQHGVAGAWWPGAIRPRHRRARR